MNVIVKLVIAPGDSQGVLGHTHGGGGWGGGDLRPLSAPGMARAGRRARGGDDGARCAGFAGGLCAGCCSQGPALARAIAGHGAADDAKWRERREGMRRRNGEGGRGRFPTALLCWPGRGPCPGWPVLLSGQARWRPAPCEPRIRRRAGLGAGHGAADDAKGRRRNGEGERVRVSPAKTGELIDRRTSDAAPATANQILH